MAGTNYTIGFHDELIATTTAFGTIGVAEGNWETKYTYSFKNFFHPFVGEIIKRLNRESLPGIMDPVWQKELEQLFFNAIYFPQNNNLQKVESFPKQIDVSEEGPYSNYNWELFFHIPLTIAVHLSKNQRFAEAQRWFHYIFDPTSNDQSVDPPKRFWKFLAFREKDPMQIDELLALLSKSQADLTDAERDLQELILAGYTESLNKPFQPHAVARTRHVAYQYNVVMKYLDNLIAWGDFLFQQDTIESINEATQRYVLAANLLGPRPQRIPPRGTIQPKTYAQLKALPNDPMGNAMVDLEAQFPFNFAPASSGTADGAANGPLFGIGRTLYFCIPRNEKLLSYWDTVADRLFKIRNCMNIAGIVRPLALFDPPIDPALLVKAAAAGIDIGSIVSGLNQPLGPVRSLPLIRKALELCEEVRCLGTALLSALEKRDAEHLALVRQAHEAGIQQTAREVKFLEWQRAQESTKNLLAVRATILQKYKFYQRALSLPDDPAVPNTIKIEGRDLTEENFDEAYAALVGTYDKQMKVQNYAALKKAGASSPAQQSGAAGAGTMNLSQSEDTELNNSLATSRDLRLAASITQTAAPILTFIPDFKIDLHFWGLGGSMDIFGGKKLADAAKLAADILRILASVEKDKADMAKRSSEHERRGDDWVLHFNVAGNELMEVGRQILTSLISEQIARHEFEKIKKQIDNTQEINDLLHERFTNEELYLWMQGETSRLYYEYYRFAFDTARKAERTMKQELMRPELDTQDFIKFNYWDGGRKGLLSGDALHLDLNRLEMAYHDNNKRELELTRAVSIRQLDPIGLLALKSTGSCQVTIPEWLYDRDCPGLYMRRLKSVGLSVNTTGPQPDAVCCTLSLLRSSVRKSPIPKDGEYVRQGVGDDRFIDYAGPIQSIVTSGAANDSGMFEVDLKEDRFLPFEGAGAESTWKLDLPKDYRNFDYGTISDVVLHVRYTARQGVDPTKVKTSLDDLFQQVSATGANLTLAFSLQQDFPSEWASFAGGSGPFQATIRRDHFPYFTQGRQITITEMQLYGENVAKHHTTGNPATATSDLQANNRFDYSAPPDGPGPTQVLTRTATTPIYLIIRYTI